MSLANNNQVKFEFRELRWSMRYVMETIYIDRAVWRPSIIYRYRTQYDNFHSDENRNNADL